MTRALSGVVLVLVLVGVGFWGAGCGSETATVVPASTTTTVPKEVARSEAIARVQAALGLGADAVSESSDLPSFSEAADLVLKWSGGRAEVDLQTGDVLAVIQSAPAGSTAGASFTAAELDAAANDLMALLGWDAATLAARGFVLQSSGFVDHAEGADEYCLTWAVSDADGAPTGELIDLRLDASTKSLRSFVVVPAPEPDTSTGAS